MGDHAADESNHTWLLDTSTFYWCSSKQSQARLFEAADGARMTTSPSSAFEILAGVRGENFSDRQNALRAIESVCGKTGILAPQPDLLVEQGFGLGGDDLPVDITWEGIQAGICARDAAQLEAAVDDLQARVRRRVDVGRLRTWDRDVGRFFSTQVGNRYARVDPKLRDLAREAGFAGHDAARMARLLAAVNVTEDPWSRRFALVGLAARGGLIREDELRLLEVAGDETVMAMLTNLVERAEAAYKGTLGGFIEVYVHYHGYLAATGRESAQNDCLDLNPFVYFGTDSRQRYVTGEDMWLKIVRLVDDTRAIDAKTFSRPA